MVFFSWFSWVVHVLFFFFCFFFWSPVVFLRDKNSSTLHVGTRTGSLCLWSSASREEELQLAEQCWLAPVFCLILKSSHPFCFCQAMIPSSTSLITRECSVDGGVKPPRSSCLKKNGGRRKKKKKKNGGSRRRTWVGLNTQDEDELLLQVDPTERTHARTGKMFEPLFSRHKISLSPLPFRLLLCSHWEESKPVLQITSSDVSLKS